MDPITVNTDDEYDEESLYQESSSHTVKVEENTEPSSESCRHAPYARTGCLRCGVNESIRTEEVKQKRKDDMDAYLKFIRKKRIPVKEDGHCLPRAVFRGAKEQDLIPQIYKYSSLMDCAVSAIKANMPRYAGFLIENGPDPEEALNLFVNDRKYYLESNIIDVIVVALSVVTGCSIKIYYQDVDQSFSNHIIHSEHQVEGRCIELAFMNNHYDLILNTIKEEPNNRSQSIIGTTHNINHTSDKEDDHLNCSVNSIDEFEDVESEEPSSSTDDDDHLSETSTTGEFGRKFWTKTPRKNVLSVPENIDGKCVYVVEAASRQALLEACRDTRPWKHDTRSKWANYRSVRYRNCKGQYHCPNSECGFLKQFGEENRLRFDKSNACSICGAVGRFVECTARKYTAFKSDTKAHIYHVGEHTCKAKLKQTRPIEIVQNSLLQEPRMTPSAIQKNAILRDIRARKEWDDVNTTIKQVACKKTISNEKIKQTKSIYEHGFEYKAVKDFKDYMDKKDKFLVYEINENEHYVFKSSKSKLKMAKDMMQVPPYDQEFCCFDGKENRTVDFTTLTASSYHPLLQKQIPLATMECKSEDTMNVGKFWRLFNQAFKDANDCTEKFEPIGWITDMASANVNGLAIVYGEDVINKAKGCEFHFKQSVNRRKGVFSDEKQSQFCRICEALLCAGTSTAYTSHYEELQRFITENEGTDLIPWLTWWHNRRHIMFRAFTGQNKPRSNLAEVCHASWVNRGQVGLPLIGAVEDDVTDSLLFEQDTAVFAITSTVPGSGPSAAKRVELRGEREVEAANQVGAGILMFGVRRSPSREEFPLSQDNGWQAETKKKRTAVDLFSKRLKQAEESEMKIRKVEKVNGEKLKLTVANSERGKKNYLVEITNTPCCSCSEYKKNKAKVVCNHIVFAVIIALHGSTDIETSLRNRYLSESDLKTLISTKIASKYIQKPKKRNAVLRRDLRFNDLQTLTLHTKVGRQAKCRACRVDIDLGTNCFVVGWSNCRFIRRLECRSSKVLLLRWVIVYQCTCTTLDEYTSTINIYCNG